LGKLAALADWGETDNLIQAVRQIQERMEQIHESWVRPFVGPRFAFDSFVGLLPFAERGVLAIRSGAGLWCQSYEEGWPVNAPFRSELAGDTGLMIAASLTPDWFTGLPFTMEGVERFIPDVARSHVELEWHESDDLLPAHSPDPQSVLRKQNIARWF
jgi:hypothetical protein